ncbi:extracellular solute-binding protein [Paenibacillus sp. MMS20-IR301]|uniref:ABC transporter substrate-binding protein n=1 Tax=Paenibacillus sp. MMS20-IR301 TaxID=2895946 RepID=UPI0028E9BB50|nr:extracellular solute-binding protein [Paenibacillus sp. MMS20-IR301]WNS43172.1 extracellular solute-binding protein [Paenibacillus sp. MMS20-IR301]
MNTKWSKQGLLGAAAALLILMTGCGNNSNSSGNGNAGPSAGSNASAPKEKVSIEVWVNSRHDLEVRESLIKKFNETNPDNIEINYKVFADNYEEQLKLALNAGNLPDIAYNISADLANAGYPLDLNPLITPEIRARFDESALTVPPTAKNGELDRVFENVTTVKLIYNKDLFKASGLDPEKPPVTWQEMSDYAKQITASGGGQKFGLGLPVKQTVFWRYYVIYPSALSGDINGREGWNAVTGKYDFSPFAKYVKWWIDVNKEGSVFPGVGTYDNDMIRAQFAEGNIGMLSAATWDIGVFNDQFPAKNDWAVADFPTWDGKQLGGTPYETANGFSINKNSKHLEEAKKAWEFLISDEMFVELARKGLGSFTNLAAQDKAIQPTDRKGTDGFVIGADSVDYPMAPRLDYSVVNPPLKVGSLDVSKSAVVNDVMNQLFMTSKDLPEIEKTLQELGDAFNKLAEANTAAGTIDLNNYLKPDFKPLKP